ncbi:MAG: hypothetical protein IJU79_02145 [Desulfovibrionaceae bacterium]|nr:hypothetical protein [Desulfovibrionaceae bacterium]
MKIECPCCNSRSFDAIIVAKVRINRNCRILKYYDWDIDSEHPVVCRVCGTVFKIGTIKDVNKNGANNV